MRGLTLGIALSWFLAASAHAQVPVDRVAEHQRRAQVFYANGQHAKAGGELLEAFWIGRNTYFLLGAAQAYELGGKPDEAAAVYFLYLNLAPLGPEDRERIRQKIIGPRAAPRPSATAPAPAPATVAPSPVPSIVDPFTDEPETAAEPPPPAPPPPEEARPAPRPRKRPHPPRFEAPRPVPADSRDLVTKWYGLPMLITEVGSMSLVAGGIGSDNEAVTAIGVLGMVFGGPIVHSVNGRSGGLWFGAWALRGLGAVVGGSVTDDLSGVFLGYAVGAAIDIIFVAKKTVRAEPTVTVTTTGSTVGVAWTF